MNARPMPISTSPDPDIAALEFDTPHAITNSAGLRFIRALDVPLEDICLHAQGLHLHMIRLHGTSRIGHDIEVCGSGPDHAQATRSGLYPAIAHFIHADYTRTLTFEACKVADYLKLPGVEEAFADVLPILAEQPDCSVALTAFKEMGGARTLKVPAALVNPEFLRGAEAGLLPRSLKDDFDYRALRNYSSNSGTAAGATQDEALLQGMLIAQEQMAAGQFAVQGLGQRQACYLRQVDMSTLPPQIRSLWEMTETREGYPVHLFDISGDGVIPTYLACVEGPTSVESWFSAGAGFTCEHAATRALRSLLQAHELTAWCRSRHGHDTKASVLRNQQDFLDVHEGAYRRFSIKNIKDILDSKGFDTVAFGKPFVTLAETLAGRIKQLHESFERSGMTVWLAQANSTAIGNDVAWVQVLLTPFNTDFLLLDGAPVGVPLASPGALPNAG